jgi:hypothetical protein
LKKEIIKKFSLKNSYNSLVHIKKRCNKINHISKNFLFVPFTLFEVNNYEIISKQIFIISEKVRRAEKLILLKNLALNLAKLEKLNIVHGDINFKNIVFTKKRIFLIDWEPVLIKRINKNFFLKSTFPYYSFSDLKSKKITRKTDLIGFLFLCESLFSGKVYTFNFSNLKNDKWLEEYTKIKNYIFFKLTFIEIYDLVRLKYKT